MTHCAWCQVMLQDRVQESLDARQIPGPCCEGSKPWKGLSRALCLEQHELGDFPAYPSVTGPQSTHKGQALRTSVRSSPGSCLGTFLGDATSVVFKR